MSVKSIFCIVISRLQAAHILEQLRNAGFAQDDISALFPEQTPAHDPDHETSVRHKDSPLGIVITWLHGRGAVAIPGMGPFVAAGPLVEALDGAAVGAALGGISRALNGMGIPENEARRYEGKLRSGNILLSVGAHGAEHLAAAKKIFLALGALDIFTVGEALPMGQYRRDPAGQLLFT